MFFRAIYFAAYSKSKDTFNGIFVPNSGAVHMSSAGFAGETLGVGTLKGDQTIAATSMNY